MACRDCILGRKEYGAHKCTAHYDAKKDNARAVKQTGRGIALNKKRSANPNSLEHAQKMSAYRKMDNNPGVKEYANDYNKKVHMASKALKKKKAQ